MTDNPSHTFPGVSRRRVWVNSLTKRTVAAGGIAVICAIALIIGYLLWVVIPMLAPASIKPLARHDTTLDTALHVASDDRFETVTVFHSDGRVEFRNPANLAVVDEVGLLATALQSVKPVFPTADTYAALTSDQDLVFFKISHRIRFDGGDRRRIENHAETLFNGSTISLADELDHDVYLGENKLRIATRDREGTITVLEFDDVDEQFELEDPRELKIDAWKGNAQTARILLGPRGRWLYEIDQSNGSYRLIEIASISNAQVVAEGSFIEPNDSFVLAAPILGRYSFLVAAESGVLGHWSLGPTDEGSDFRKIREFSFVSPIGKVITEHRRKGFLAIEQSGIAHLGFTTTRRILASTPMGEVPRIIEFSPRGDRLLAVGEKSTDIYTVSNKHPEISWSTLWGKVWYEGYDKPVYSWQSSSADTDFESKFSLQPLLFGTIKAAFYAMLIATPLAIMGAIYTAMFMSPGMRNWIKPGIEIMAALPTVILGFLAGLWLAPIVEKHLTAVMLLFIVLPAGVFLFALLVQLLPRTINKRFDGWFAALTIPVLVVIAYVTINNDAWISNLIFGMDAKLWFYEKAGIDYDQRNALIIGLAMGLAVIPTIFSISEDAIYGVPQHLTQGSLALGATQWQTLIRVVLLTASPGIFSAVMIGLGRAVGETMIVLMATGNTPIMDFNIFQGMRTFAANIAVEMPESEVGSTHFRILFLTAFVLFVLTFLFNTIAEVVRHRLRKRYGNL